MVVVVDVVVEVVVDVVVVVVVVIGLVVVVVVVVVVDGQLPDFLQYSEEVIAVVSVVSNMLQTIV